MPDRGQYAQAMKTSRADLSQHPMARQVPGSRLVGLGDVFVAEGLANGISPRALVAIAMHESVLGTAGSGADIHNAFGWGPAIALPSWRANIATVARGLRRGYLDRGRDTLAAIQPLWAPVGAANDPGGLNSAWVDGVGATTPTSAAIRRCRSRSRRRPRRRGRGDPGCGWFRHPDRRRRTAHRLSGRRHPTPTRPGRATGSRIGRWTLPFPSAHPSMRSTPGMIVRVGRGPPRLLGALRRGAADGGVIERRLLLRAPLGRRGARR